MQVVEGLTCISPNPSRVWVNLPEEERKEIIRYRGFDFIAWFWIEEEKKVEHYKNKFGLLPLHKIELVKSYLCMLKNNHPYSYAIYLTNDLSFNATDYLELEFIGFDIGVACEGNDPVFFSGIVNEIRSSGNLMFRELTSNLNDSYLFDDAEICHEYLRIRNSLFESGDLNFIEDAYPNENMDLFKIYLVNQ